VCTTARAELLGPSVVRGEDSAQTSILLQYQGLDFYLRFYSRSEGPRFTIACFEVDMLAKIVRVLTDDLNVISSATVGHSVVSSARIRTHVEISEWMQRSADIHSPRPHQARGHYACREGADRTLIEKVGRSFLPEVALVHRCPCSFQMLRHRLVPRTSAAQSPSNNLSLSNLQALDTHEKRDLYPTTRRSRPLDIISITFHCTRPRSPHQESASPPDSSDSHSASSIKTVATRLVPYFSLWPLC
jgi:hypothetical protein